MNIDDKTLIERLSQFGHLTRPFGASIALPQPIESLTLKSESVKDAIRSFQSLHQGVLTSLVQKHHGRSMAHVDGDPGPATMELLDMPRCGHPDYQDVPETAFAYGQGNWRGCHNIGEYHCAVVAVKTAIPSFLQPHWDKLWSTVVDIFAEVGLMLVRNDTFPKPNITFHFVKPSGSWLGLAQVVNNATCSSGPYWAQFDFAYQPADLFRMWVALLVHETIHVCGMDHESGGVMSPYLTAMREYSLKSDQAWPKMAMRFGGQPVPLQPPSSPRVMMLTWKTREGVYTDIAPVKQYDGPDVFPV